MYDSAYSHYSRFDYFAIALCTNIATQTLKITIPPVQEQRNGYDCGAFAVAFACDLAEGLDPVNRVYIRQILRPKIMNMIFESSKSQIMSTGQLVRLPNEIPQPPAVHNIDLLCTCRLPDITGFDLVSNVTTIQCTDCEETFHKSCIGNIPGNTYKWTCKRDTCRRRTNRKKVVTPMKIVENRGVYHTCKKTE